MKKSEMIGVRLTPLEKRALDEACEADRQSASAIGGRLIVDMLRDRGFLKREATQ